MFAITRCAVEGTRTTNSMDALRTLWMMIGVAHSLKKLAATEKVGMIGREGTGKDCECFMQ